MVYIQPLWHHQKNGLEHASFSGLCILPAWDWWRAQWSQHFYPASPESNNLEFGIHPFCISISSPFKTWNVKPNNELETWSIYSGTHVFAMNIHYVGNVDGRLLTPHIHGPSRPTSNSPVLQPMVSWPDMLSAAGLRHFPCETWPATPPGATHESYTFWCWNPKGWQATNHVPRNPQEFSDAILVYSDAMFVFFSIFLRCIGIEIAASTLCSYLESKHLQIYIILVKLKSSAFSLSKNCKIHQDPKRSKVLWIRLALLANSWRAMGANMKQQTIPEIWKRARSNTATTCYNNVTNDVAYKDSCSEFPTYLFSNVLLTVSNHSKQNNNRRTKTNYPPKLNQWLSVLGWWFGFLESPYERDCYLGATLESQNHQPKPLVDKTAPPPPPQRKKDEKQPVLPFCEGGRSICVTPRDEPIWFHCREPAEVVILLFRWVFRFGGGKIRTKLSGCENISSCDFVYFFSPKSFWCLVCKWGGNHQQRETPFPRLGNFRFQFFVAGICSTLACFRSWRSFLGWVHKSISGWRFLWFRVYSAGM